MKSILLLNKYVSWVERFRFKGLRLPELTDLVMSLDCKFGDSTDSVDPSEQLFAKRTNDIGPWED